MNFIRIFLENQQILRVPQDLYSYSNYVFSIGTHNNLEQVFFPFAKMNGPIQNSIIFAIDPDYHPEKLPTNLYYKYLDLRRIFNYSNMVCYYDTENNVEVYFISESVTSSYTDYRYEAAESFNYTLKCPTEAVEWRYVEEFLRKLVENRKNIYINNWAFMNSRYFKEIDGRMRCFSRDIGHFYEYFPELGYILHKLFTQYANSITVNMFITHFTHEMTISTIQNSILKIDKI